MLIKSHPLISEWNPDSQRHSTSEIKLITLQAFLHLEVFNHILSCLTVHPLYAGKLQVLVEVSGSASRMQRLFTVLFTVFSNENQ